MSSLYVGKKRYCLAKKVGVNNQDIIVTKNGTYIPDQSYSGLGVVRVNLPQPIYDEVNVTPTTENQVIEPLNDAFSKVNVSAVTSDIDENISAGNIKSGVEILGVTGTCVELNGQTTTVTENGTYTPDSNHNAFTSVTVNVPSVNNQPLTVTPSGSQQTFTPDAGHTGFSPVVVEGISSAVDANIKPENIVKGIQILGVTGTAELVLQEKHVTIDANTPTITTYTPDQDGCNGYSKFIFDLSWLEQQLQDINSGDATTELDLQEITVTDAGEYTANTGYDAIGKVIVDMTAKDAQIAQLTEEYNDLYEQYQQLLTAYNALQS